MKKSPDWEGLGPEAKLVLLIVRSLAGCCNPELIGGFLEKNQLDWAKLNRLLAYHEIYPGAYIFLKKYPWLLPVKELSFLEDNFYANLSLLARMQQEAVKILSALEAKNIPALPLKGAFFLLDASVYGDQAYLRPMQDIDILVKKEDYPRAQVTLESLGYEKALHGDKEEYWLKQNYHMAFVKKDCFGRGCMAEVHWALDYPRKAALLPQLWERTKKIEGGGKTQEVLSCEDSIFSLALHQRRFGKMLLLKSACDAALLLKNSRLDWDYFTLEAQRAGTRTTLYFVLAQAQILFGLAIPSAVLKKLRIPRYKQELIANFIFRNTFQEQPDLRGLYLKAHFLLYDGFAEPLKAAFSVPREQFAKFYKLPPYAFKTGILYNLRWFYFLKEPFKRLFKKRGKKQSFSGG